MGEGAADPTLLTSAPSLRHRRRRHRWLPFWALQVTEVAVALVFVDISVHVSSGGLLIAAAVVFLALAATADGPLGIARLCSQRLHLILAVVAAGLIGLAPLVPGLRPDIQGVIVLEFGVVGLIRLATLTRVSEAPGSPLTGIHDRSSVIDATATVARPTVPPPGPGGATGPGHRPGPGDGAASASLPTDDAARWAGRAAAAAAASGREAAARYGPEAEAQVKRTLKGAGRLAGKLASRWNPPEGPPR